MELKIGIVSVPDRDNLVAEIWSGENMIAEMQLVANEDFILEIYTSNGMAPIVLKVDELLKTLTEAQKRLSSKKT